MREPKHPTCIDVTTYGEEPGSSWICGPDCPRPASPDPERDERIAIYRDRERRKAARALDRYLEAINGPFAIPAASDAAGERFVEAVGDYVLSRLQHNGHYGVTPTYVCESFVPFDPGAPEHGTCGGCGARFADHNPCAGGRCVDPEAHAEGAHDL